MLEGEKGVEVVKAVEQKTAAHAAIVMTWWQESNETVLHGPKVED